MVNNVNTLFFNQIHFREREWWYVISFSYLVFEDKFHAFFFKCHYHAHITDIGTEGFISTVLASVCIWVVAQFLTQIVYHFHQCVVLPSLEKLGKTPNTWVRHVEWHALFWMSFLVMFLMSFLSVFWISLLAMFCFWISINAVLSMSIHAVFGCLFLLLFGCLI